MRFLNELMILWDNFKEHLHYILSSNHFVEFVRLPSSIFKRMYASVNFGIWYDFHDTVHISAYCLQRSLKLRMGAPTVLCRLQDESIVFQLTFQRQSVGFGACSAVFIGMLREHAPYHCTLHTVFDKITMVAPH